MSTFSSILALSCQIFTWTALGDVDLCIYVSHSFWQQKPMLLKRELHQPHDYVTNVINPYT
jgi:hypothetical protein